MKLKHNNGKLIIFLFSLSEKNLCNTVPCCRSQIYVCLKKHNHYSLSLEVANIFPSCSQKHVARNDCLYLQSLYDRMTRLSYLCILHLRICSETSRYSIENLKPDRLCVWSTELCQTITTGEVIQPNQSQWFLHTTTQHNSLENIPTKPASIYFCDIIWVLLNILTKHEI